MTMRRLVFPAAIVMAMALVAAGDDRLFFRVAGQTGSIVTAIANDGHVTWANTDETATSLVQRAITLAGDDAWADYARIACTAQVVTARLFTTTPPRGMTYVPGGLFLMGTDTNLFPLQDNEGWYDELPLHTVTLSPFCMDVTLVTWDRWCEVRDWAVTHGYDLGSGEGLAGDHPVQNVSWYDCVKWCNARSQKEGLTPCYYTTNSFTAEALYTNGQWGVANEWVDWSANGYRLPTEAEWEYAARGGLETRRFPWGDFLSHSNANYYSDSTYPYDISDTRGDHPLYGQGSNPVQSFAPNGYGLYDMVGNVSEWCWDWYDDAYYTRSPDHDPRGSESAGNGRILRGGGWGYNAQSMRIAYRGNPDPASAWAGWGFRAVKSAP